MKVAKVLLLLAGFVFLTAADVFAQVEPNLTAGTFEVGKSVAFRYSKDKYDVDEITKENTTTSIEFQPRVGYFVNQNIEIEGDIILGYVKDKHETTSGSVSSESESKDTRMGLIARGMYNLVGTSPMVPFFFAGAGFIMNSNDLEGEEAEGTEETSLVLPEAGVGIKYFLGDHVAALGAVYFRRVTNAGGMKDWTATNIGFAAGLTMFLGQK